MISFIIVALSLYLIFVVWYPFPLNKAVGVDKITLLMFCIDLILGPILTLILAKQGKRGMKFDFFVIGLLQLSALAYGMNNIAKGRPVYISFYYNRFELVQDMATTRNDSDNIPPVYAKNPWFGYKWVAVRQVKDEEEQNDWLFDELSTGVSPAARPKLYESVQKNMDYILKNSLMPQRLYDYNDKVKVDRVLGDYPSADGYLPLRADTQMSIMVSKKDRKILSIVDLRPE